MTYIWHVTLNSGHVAKQERSNISEEAIAALADTLDGILQGAHLQIPGVDNYLVNASHHGHDLIATVWRGPWDRRAPIVTTATALKSRSAKSLWELMHDQSTVPLRTDRGRPPTTPWQADRIEVGASLHPDALSWTGDFSRCLAWSWAEYRGMA
jgi:hypothetical protein